VVIFPGFGGLLRRRGGDDHGGCREPATSPARRSGPCGAGWQRAFLRALLRSRSAAQRALAGVSSEIATNPELRAAWHRGLGGMLTGCVRQIVTRAAARGELAPDADIDLLSQLPLSLLQNWRLEHAGQPGDDIADRIVRQFYTPAAPSRRAGEGGA
jgi:hypothetical protein